MVCCFAAPRQVRSIQRSVSRPVLLSLDTSFELSRLDYGSATLAGIPKYILDVCCRPSKQQHVSFTEPASTTMCLHCFSNCIYFCSWTHQISVGRTGVSLPVWHGSRVAFMARDLQWATDTDSRQRLRSSSSHQLIVPRTRLFTVGDRAFGAAAARIWNSLPPTVISAAAFNSLKNHLKTYLFHCSNSSLRLSTDFRLSLWTCPCSF